MKIKKGDKVKITAGKDIGKIGTVLRVLPQENKVVVEGINVVKKHVKPGTVSKEGGIIKKEMPIDASNVMYYDDQLGRPVRLGFRVVDGKKYRVNKITDEVIEG
jgi:large subunit ribosomal protein L24